MEESWYPLTNRGLNVYRVDAWSTDSGVSSDTMTRATYFDGVSREPGGISSYDESVVRDVLTEKLAQWYVGILLLKDESGGGFSQVRYARTDMDIAAVSWHLVPGAPTGGPTGSAVFHELGHAAFGLGDEYPCPVDPDRACRRDGERYTGPEPMEPNLTTVTDRNQLKWKFWVFDEVAIPTMKKENCSDRTREPNVLGPGHDFTIGLFEGACGQNCDIYRPAYTCTMRTNEGRFCAVCQSAIQDVTNPFWPPIRCVIEDLFGAGMQPAGTGGPAGGSGPASESRSIVDRFRAFRDRELRTRAVGQQYLRLLRAHSLELVEIFRKDDVLKAQAVTILGQVHAALATERPCRIDHATIEHGRNFLAKVAAAGSPALRRAIDDVKGDLEHLRGVPLAQALQRADRAWSRRLGRHAYSCLGGLGRFCAFRLRR